jgi:hypothetical protein
MRMCPNCSFLNREGFFFCEDCGQNLKDSTSVILPTRRINQQLPMTAEQAARPNWGTARLTENAAIVLHIRDSAVPLTLPVTQRIIMGRRDSNSPHNPDLDLSPYGALEKGVSRIHAAIYRSEDTLTLVDMGSSNGTLLNGQRLIPQQPRVLRDGDEIRLGKLTAHIYFRSE